MGKRSGSIDNGFIPIRKSETFAKIISQKNAMLLELKRNLGLQQKPGETTRDLAEIILHNEVPQT